MRFAKWVFAIAGIYGLIIMLPLYFAETQIGIAEKGAARISGATFLFACIDMTFGALFVVAFGLTGGKRVS